LAYTSSEYVSFSAAAMNRKRPSIAAFAKG
jgi:hypothetical protein